MSDANIERPHSWQDGMKGFTDELGRMIAVRRELAQLEIRHDRALVQWFLKVGGTGVVMVLVGLPLIMSSVAHALENVTPWSDITWLLILGCGIAVPGVLSLAIAWRKVRTGFCGLRSTLAELNEDLVWLREWSESRDAQQ